MKRTEVGLLRHKGRLFFRTVCAGMLAGAMAAVSALPAMAAVTNPKHPAVIPGGVIEDSYQYLLNLDFGTIKKGFSNGSQMVTFEEKLPNTIPLEIYKVAEVTEYPGAEGVYEYNYLGEKHPDVEAGEMVDNANNDQNLQEYIKFYEENAASLTPADEITETDGSAVTEYFLNKEYNLGYGTEACGVYFIRQKDGTSFKIGNTTYTIGSVLISVPNYDAHQEQEAGMDVFTITVKPKPVKMSSYTPPGPPNDNGGPPPSRRIVPPPPSEGSVLGASRDEIPPEVLGANRLPQTGQLWWPVPILCIMGLGLIVSGVHRRKAVEAVH